MDLVTGGTGFIGSHVVRALRGDGTSVRCLVRPTSDRSNLEGLSVEYVAGDLMDPSSLREAMKGVDRVFHCAADYRLYAPDPQSIYATNVEGTRNVLRAAADAGVDRVVYTSSVGTLAVSDDGTVVDEATPVTLDDVVGHYKRSKFQAERVAEQWAQDGLPVVIVNPSTPVGERDIKPTPTGQIIVDYLNGDMYAYVETGMNLIDVRDVARGHLLAAKRGRVGEKYILGHRNMELREIFDLLSDLTDIPSPRVKLPHWIPLTVAAADTAWARLWGHEPSVSLESVRMSQHTMYFDASKAVQELGLPQTPIEEALRRAVRWFEARGYVEE